MTVREYIGARYVPIFADPIEWNPNSIYEALTVVKHEGASYVSRQSVPEGIQLSNTDYWILWADYNAQIEAYRQEVLTFDGRITQNAEDIDTLENDVNNLENRGKVVIAIGDSYGEGWDPDTSTSHDGWCEKLATYLNKSGRTCKYAATGGYGFVAGNNGFLTLLQKVVNAMTANEKIRCDKVLIAGGFNDRLASAQNVFNGIGAVVTYVKNNLPNATVYISHVGYCVTGLTTGSFVDATAQSCNTSYRNYYAGATQHGAKFDCGSITALYRNSLFTSDYVHPNSNGNTEIAKRLCNFILDGTPISSNGLLADYLTPIGNWTVYSSKNELLYVVDGSRGFCSGIGLASDKHLEIRTESPTSQSLSLGTRIQLGFIRCAGLSGINYAAPVFGILHDSTNDKYYSFKGALQIGITGAAFIAVTEINATNSNYLSISLDRIQLRFAEGIFF